MFRQLPTWLRMIAIGVATLVTLWLTWGVIFLLFAFALVPAIAVAAIASLFIVFGPRRLVRVAISHR
jgi:TM2 domain-containing membrane protein YozV